MSCKLPPENYPHAFLKAFLGQKTQHGFRESDESVCVCGCLANLKRLLKTSIHSRGPAAIKQTLASKAMLGGGCTA